jgi:hypothetical protein
MYQWTKHAQLRWVERVATPVPDLENLNIIKSYPAARAEGTVIVIRHAEKISSLIVDPQGMITTCQRGEPKTSAKSEHQRRTKKQLQIWIKFCHTLGLNPVGDPTAWQAWTNQIKNPTHAMRGVGNAVRSWHRHLGYTYDETQQIFPATIIEIDQKKIRL